MTGLSIFIENGIFQWPRNDTLFGPFNIEIKNGSVVAAVGLNGSGKSTLLKVISGEYGLIDGRITYPTMNNGNTDWLQSKRQIRFVITHHTQFSPFGETIKQSLIGSARKAGITLKSAQLQKDRLIEAFGLKAFENYEWHELSSGYRQRVAIARAFSSCPAIILLDEPFENLDIISKQEVADAIVHLHKDEEFSSTVVIATQDLDLAESISDQIIVMDDGSVIFDIQSNEISDALPNSVFEVTFSDAKSDVAEDIAKFFSATYRIVGNRVIFFLPKGANFISFVERIVATDAKPTSVRDLSSSLRPIFYGLKGEVTC